MNNKSQAQKEENIVIKLASIPKHHYKSTTTPETFFSESKLSKPENAKSELSESKFPKSEYAKLELSTKLTSKHQF